MRARQIERLERIRRVRDPGRCDAALVALTEAAKSGNGNLLALAIENLLANKFYRRDSQEETQTKVPVPEAAEVASAVDTVGDHV